LVLCAQPSHTWPALRTSGPEKLRPEATGGPRRVSSSVLLPLETTMKTDGRGGWSHLLGDGIQRKCGQEILRVLLTALPLNISVFSCQPLAFLQPVEKWLSPLILIRGALIGTPFKPRSKRERPYSGLILAAKSEHVSLFSSETTRMSYRICVIRQVRQELVLAIYFGTISLISQRHVYTVGSSLFHSRLGKPMSLLRKSSSGMGGRSSGGRRGRANESEKGWRERGGGRQEGRRRGGGRERESAWRGIGKKEQ
jgi:hypothetical protein